MSEPKIAAKNPIGVSLEPGTYYWCACGKSKKQPFCDGSHQDTDILPVQFKIAEKTDAYLCQCKHTGNPPYCDGSHQKL